MNKSRLREVVRVLKRVPDRMFSTWTWATDALAHWSLAHPRAVLKVDADGPRWGRKDGIVAIATYFGIELEDVRPLFIAYGTRRQVIARIEAFVGGVK